MDERPQIGRLLVRAKVVSQRDLELALEEQRSGAGTARVCSRLFAMSKASQADLVRALSEQLGVMGIDLAVSSITLEALDLFPREVARRQRFLPLSYAGERLILAMANPTDEQTLEEIRFVSGMEVAPMVALEDPLRAAIEEAYNAARERLTTWAGPNADPDGLALGGILAEVDGSIVSQEGEAQRARLESEEELPATPAGGERILVVDDEESILELCRAALEKNGYIVETAGRGMEALEKVRSFEPELVLLDAMLPEVHGFEVCRKIKQSKKFANVPVVMMSAVYTGWRYAEDAREAYGADDYIEKPFRLEELLRKVRERLQPAPEMEDAAPAPELTGEADVAYRRGVELFKDGQFVDAAAAFEAAAVAEPTSARIQFSLGRTLEAAGDAYRAMKAYEVAVTLRPDLFPALKSLAALYQQKGFRRKAIEAFERAVPAAPDDPTREEIKRALLALL